MKEEFVKFADGFVYKVVNYKQAKAIIECDIMDVFVLHLNDETEALLCSVQELDDAKEKDCIFGIEVGYIDGHLADQE